MVPFIWIFKEIYFIFKFYIWSHHRFEISFAWLNCNLYDTAISVGALLCLVVIFQNNRRERYIRGFNSYAECHEWRTSKRVVVKMKLAVKVINLHDKSKKNWGAVESKGEREEFKKVASSLKRLRESLKTGLFPLMKPVALPFLFLILLLNLQTSQFLLETIKIKMP